MEEFISSVDGVWHNYVNFDGVEYWRDDKEDPYLLEYEKNPLPSDSVYR